MSPHAEAALSALGVLLQSSRQAGASHLPRLVSHAAHELGAEAAELYVATYDEVLLVPLADETGSGDMEPLAIDGTLGGRAYVELEQQLTASADGGHVLWSPVLDGTDRLGVLRLQFPAGVDVDEHLRSFGLQVATLLAEMVTTRSMNGDAIELARRRTPMTLPAEVQRRLLPPLAFVSERVALAGALSPVESAAGDSFDYALDGDVAHVAIFDAMGHGLEASLLSTVAVSALRNVRRAKRELADTVRVIDAAIGAQFAPGTFVTGIVARLDVTTGSWQWVACGHPPALVVRDGRVVKTLDEVVEPPLGLGLLGEDLKIGQERLQPGDRLVLYSDGVVEARDTQGEYFGVQRLAEFVIRQFADGRPVAETLRRLNRAILEHQQGVLQDDATTVIVEWLSDESVRTTL